MKYQPSHWQLSRRARPALEAIPVASFGATVVGTISFVLFIGTLWVRSEIFGPGFGQASASDYLVTFAFCLALGMLLSALLLAAFWLPASLLLQSRLRGPSGIILVIATTPVMALIAAYSVIDAFGLGFDENNYAAGIIMLAITAAPFALAAAFLYRQTVMLLSDELGAD